MSAHPSRGLFVRGVVLLAVFAVAHLAGLRDFLPLLSGSPAPGNYSRLVQAICCTSYLLFYFAAVLVAPVLIIAAGLLRLGSRAAPCGTGGKGSTPDRAHETCSDAPMSRTTRD